jgi:hypothetical protein
VATLTNPNSAEAIAAMRQYRDTGCNGETVSGSTINALVMLGSLAAWAPFWIAMFADSIDGYVVGLSAMVLFVHAMCAGQGEYTNSYFRWVGKKCRQRQNKQLKQARNEQYQNGNIVDIDDSLIASWKQALHHQKVPIDHELVHPAKHYGLFKRLQKWTNLARHPLTDDGPRQRINKLVEEDITRAATTVKQLIVDEAESGQIRQRYETEQLTSATNHEREQHNLLLEQLLSSTPATMLLD